MYKPINIGAAVEHVKNIVDSIRCAVCDKSGGTRMRYACGHTSCEDCVVVAPDCSVCLTPQNIYNEPTADQPFIERAENAVNLLNVFQNEFHIDVYKRQRISEQLKIEKELFPECIQAPIKYFNKRKSYKDINSKEVNRLSQLPGEEISLKRDHKMEPSENVEKWLNKYLRKPFADLNSNDERLRKVSGVIKKQQNVVDIENENAPMLGSIRKRSHFKTADTHITPVKKKEYCKKPRVKNNLNVKSDASKNFNTGTKVTDNDESGIVMDDEPVIVIDGSQSIRVDKDMNAWLAVQEAENNKQYDSKSIMSSKFGEVIPKSQDIEKSDVVLTTKVPFYLKSSLSKQCYYCIGRNHEETEMAGPNVDKHVMEPNKDVSVTVENKSFTATIRVKIIDKIQNKVNSLHSTEIQTDISNPVIFNKRNQMQHDNEYVKRMSQIIACKSPSQDLFQDDVNIEDVKTTVNEGTNFKYLNKTQHIIIGESDSDGELNASESIEVTAEIHRSCEEIDYGILADVDDLEQHSKRARRTARGFTPTSTDSSNKENFNPNRRKKVPSSKKKPIKK